MCGPDRRLDATLTDDGWPTGVVGMTRVTLRWVMPAPPVSEVVHGVSNLALVGPLSLVQLTVFDSLGIFRGVGVTVGDVDGSTRGAASVPWTITIDGDACP